MIFGLLLFCTKIKKLIATKSNLPSINKGWYFLHGTRGYKIQHQYIQGKFAVPYQVHLNSTNMKQVGIHAVTPNKRNTVTSNYLIPPQFYIVIDIGPNNAISNIWQEAAYFPPHIIRLKRNTINSPVKEPCTSSMRFCWCCRRLNQFCETFGIIIGLRTHSNHSHRW